MKLIMALAILLGIVAASASAYGLIETKPNYDSVKASIDDTPAGMEDLTLALLEDYRGTLWNLIYLAGGAGGLAVILGGIAIAKGKHPTALIGVLLGLVGAAVGLLTIPS